jgi:hypothetical protein
MGHIEGMQLREFIKAQMGLDTPLFPEGKQLSSNAQNILLPKYRYST